MADLHVVDYASLKQAIADWLNRSDLLDNIPQFIQLFESRINRELRYRGMLVRDTMLVPSTDEEFENLPEDFLELKELRFLSNPEVEPRYRTPSALVDFRARYTGQGGTPRHYTIVGGQIQFDRVATGSPRLEIVSYVRLPALSDDFTVNALLSDAPDMYLFGSLMMAEPFLKNDSRLATWTALYQDAKTALEKADRASEQSPGPLVQQSRRVF